MIRRSAVSNSFGRSLRKNPPMPPGSFGGCFLQGGTLGCGGGGGGGQEGGTAGGSQTGSGGGAGALGGTFGADGTLA